MLTRYLEKRYAVADSAEQQAFLRLLECEDTELMRYLMGEAVVDNKSLVHVIGEIRNLPA